MPKQLSIILIEGSFLIQAGIEILIQEIPHLRLTDIFDGSENKLIDKIQYKKPDIVIINPNSLKEKLIHIVNQINKNGICIVGLVDNNSPAHIRGPFQYCLEIGDGKYELLEVLKKIGGKGEEKDPDQKMISAISDRELTILKMVVQGYTNQEIADKLFLSIHTITTHRKNISRKLGIKTVSGLTVYALMNKVVLLSEIEQK